MARDWLSRDRRLRKRKTFKSDNRKSVRNISRILEKKAKDIKEKELRKSKELDTSFETVLRFSQVETKASLFKHGR